MSGKPKITQENFHRLLAVFTEAVREFRPVLEPYDYIHLGSMLANIVGPIPKEKWKAILAAAAEPCNEPDCSCEKLSIRFFEVASELRADWLINIKGEME